MPLAPFGLVNAPRWFSQRRTFSAASSFYVAALGIATAIAGARSK